MNNFGMISFEVINIYTYVYLLQIYGINLVNEGEQGVIHIYLAIFKIQKLGIPCIYPRIKTKN